MKKIFAVLSVFVLALAFAGCEKAPAPEEKYFFDYAPPSPESDDSSAVNVSELQGLRDESGFRYYNPLVTDKMEISGFAKFEENGQLYRLDIKNSSAYNANLNELAYNTAGGKIRFRTDSSQLVINVTLHHYTESFVHMALTGVAGLDVYTGKGEDMKWLYTLQPTKGSNRMSYTLTITESGMKDICINMPLYSGIASIEVGLLSTAKIGEPTPYTYDKPIVFYGSSITQGGCASAPANSYTDIICKMLDARLINLGFSGGAHGEEYMADFIAGIDEMSAFVMDYDHNALSVKELQDTHYNFYKKVRDAHPDIPIILITKSDVAISDTDVNSTRRAVIEKTYRRAIEEGDENIYFISGMMTYGTYNRDLFMVDGCHPNDLGMYKMAETIFPVLKEALEKKAG